MNESNNVFVRQGRTDFALRRNRRMPWGRSFSVGRRRKRGRAGGRRATEGCCCSRGAVSRVSLKVARTQCRASRALAARGGLRRAAARRADEQHHEADEVGHRFCEGKAARAVDEAGRGEADAVFDCVVRNL